TVSFRVQGRIAVHSSYSAHLISCLAKLIKWISTHRTSSVDDVTGQGKLRQQCIVREKVLFFSIRDVFIDSAVAFPAETKNCSSFFFSQRSSASNNYHECRYTTLFNCDRIHFYRAEEKHGDSCGS